MTSYLLLWVTKSLRKGTSLKERIRKIKLAELLPPRVYIQVHSSILQLPAAIA